MRPLWSGLMVLAWRTASTMRFLAEADTSPLTLAGSEESWPSRSSLLIAHRVYNFAAVDE